MKILDAIKKIIRHTLCFMKRSDLGKERFGLMYHYATLKLFDEHPDEQHLTAAINWLCLGQDYYKGRGISNAFFIDTGWGPAYPETSGYAIATLLAFANHSKNNTYVERAIQIANWEIDIQTPDGGVISNEKTPHTRIFNTAQVLLGWCSLFDATHDKKYLDAAIRAGNYLIENQDADGAWRKNTHCGARTYHARVDWALLRLSELTGDDTYAESAKRNLDWVLVQQIENGWFSNCGFNNSDPITHVIAYTIQGLLESSMTQHPTIQSMPLLEAAIKAADALCVFIEKYPVNNIAGMVPASFDHLWKGDQTNSCLTGNAQMAICFFRLFQITQKQPYRTMAEKVLAATKRTQNLDTEYAPIHGGIPGSYPLFRGYCENAFPNWAAKFFADALLMKLHLSENIIISA